MSSNRCRESMKLEVAECLEHALEQLRAIWDEIGICEEQRAERQGVVLHHLRSLLSEMVTEERDLRGRLVASVERCGQEAVALAAELGLDPFQAEEGLTILQLEKVLRQKVDCLAKEKSERLDRLKTLQDRDQSLCDLLCSTPYYVPSNTVPTAEQLDTLSEHIDKLTVEKNSRQATLHSTKAKIITLLEALEQGPNTTFERDIVCEEEEAFLLSRDNMEALRTLHDELEFKRHENEAEAERLREQIGSLFSRLLLPAEEREAFLAGHPGHKPTDIRLLQEELAKMEELKIQNLKRVTLASRDEIAEWWDKCYYSRLQRNEFEAYYDDEFTEEVLLLHDEELVKLKAYYENNKKLLEGVRNREVMWKKMLEFENKASDPNRYNNRGGNLLQEEKERKKINRDLPKLEKILADEIQSFEEQRGEPFLVDGCRFMDYVQMQWAAHEQEKKLKKEERLRARTVQTENEMTFGSKPNTPAKRRFNAPGTKTPSKRMKGMNGTVCGPSPRLGVTHSSIMPSPSPARRPPRACRATPTSAAKSAPCPPPPAAAYVPRIPFPSPSSSVRRPPKGARRKEQTPKRVLRPTGARLAQRKALGERNADMSHAFSTSTISGGMHGPAGNISITSACSSYSDFARDFDTKRMNNCRSSSASSPTALTSSRAKITLL